MTNRYTMNVSCKEALTYFNTDYVIYKEILGKVYIQMVNYPVVGGQTAKVSRKNGNCRVFTISSLYINDKKYYEMVKVNHNWYRLDQIDPKKITHGVTRFISSSVLYDSRVTSKVINGSKRTLANIFNNYAYIETITLPNGKEEFYLTNNPIGKRVHKISVKANGKNVVVRSFCKRLQKGKYYTIKISKYNARKIIFTPVTKKHVMSNKNKPDFVYISVSR